MVESKEELAGPEEIEAAARILRAGGLVVFPTETVYGVGADAGSAEAVRRIFAAKGRPSTNPLIVHVANAGMARRCAAEWPDEAEALSSAFWPGPLTLVVRRSGRIPAIVTAGRETVGVRVPDHPVALRLLEAFGGPIAAPSANRSNRVSPTTAEHAREELGGRVDLILDGGPCRVGIESTVLAVGGEEHPVILREGVIGRGALEAVVGKVIGAGEGVVDEGEAAESPGRQAVHYAPMAEAMRYEAGEEGVAAEWLERNRDRTALVMVRAHSAAIGRLERAMGEGHEMRLMPEEAREYGRELYAMLHAADVRGFSAIWIEMPPEAEEWRAVRDRLIRATKAG